MARIGVNIAVKIGVNTPPNMTVNILFFAALREQLQCREFKLPLTGPCLVQEVLFQLQQSSVLFQQVLSEQMLLCAVNQQLCNLDALVQPGDELAFFPPVTGG